MRRLLLLAGLGLLAAGCAGVARPAGSAPSWGLDIGPKPIPPVGQADIREIAEGRVKQRHFNVTGASRWPGYRHVRVQDRVVHISQLEGYYLESGCPEAARALRSRPGFTQDWFGWLAGGLIGAAVLSVGQGTKPLETQAIGWAVGGVLGALVYGGVYYLSPDVVRSAAYFDQCLEKKVAEEMARLQPSPTTPQ